MVEDKLLKTKLAKLTELKATKIDDKLISEINLFSDILIDIAKEFPDNN